MSCTEDQPISSGRAGGCGGTCGGEQGRCGAGCGGRCGGRCGDSCGGAPKGSSHRGVLLQPASAVAASGPPARRPQPRDGRLVPELEPSVPCGVGWTFAPLLLPQDTLRPSRPARLTHARLLSAPGGVEVDRRRPLAEAFADAGSGGRGGIGDWIPGPKDLAAEQRAQTRRRRLASRRSVRFSAEPCIEADGRIVPGERAARAGGPPTASGGSGGGAQACSVVPPAHRQPARSRRGPRRSRAGCVLSCG